MKNLPQINPTFDKLVPVLGQIGTRLGDKIADLIDIIIPIDGGDTKGGKGR